MIEGVFPPLALLFEELLPRRPIINGLGLALLQVDALPHRELLHLADPRLEPSLARLDVTLFVPLLLIQPRNWDPQDLRLHLPPRRDNPREVRHQNPPQSFAAPVARRPHRTRSPTHEELRILSKLLPKLLPLPRLEVDRLRFVVDPEPLGVEQRALRKDVARIELDLRKKRRHNC